jgi:hypothetical protein
MLWIIIAEHYIKSFESFIDVHKDGVMVVRERIVVDFGEEERHGIYRTIPYYSQGRKLEFRLISVEDDSGSSYQVLEKKEGGEVYWRIGDPEVLIKGKKVYNITYKVNGAINYFKEHDEIYWNVNGTEWEMEIKEISCIVNLPEGVDVSKVKYTFYTGKKGSREQNGKAWIEGNKVFFKAGPFKAGENLTIVVGLPKGVLIEPPKPSWISRNWGLLFMIFLPLISLLYMLYQYFRYGRDPRIYRSIMVEYEPPDNLKPAEIGTLVDEYADDRDIVATIIDLAIRGYLKIKPLGDKDVEIEILREGNDLEGYEKEIFEAIKESAEDGKVLRLGESLAPSKAKEYVEKYEKLYKAFESVKDEVYDSLTQRDYFQEKPDVVRKKYASLGIGMFVIALFTASVLQHPDIGNANLFFIAFIMVPAFPLILLFTLWGEVKKYSALSIISAFFILSIMYIILFIIAFFILHMALMFLSNGAISALHLVLPNGTISALHIILHHPSIEVPLGIVLAGVIISFMGRYMPRRTERGVEMYKRVLGFKEFIKRVEEDRLKRMMEEDPTKLERIVPYAIVLGIENIWIEKISKVINYIDLEDIREVMETAESIRITISSLSTYLSTVPSHGTYSGGWGGFMDVWKFGGVVGGGRSGFESEGRSGGGAGGGGGGTW